ncbi:MAG: membrane dipeptidase [Luteitalea sp.]|nr:membrane dipeptidase [Luteitalea sp.]
MRSNDQIARAMTRRLVCLTVCALPVLMSAQPPDRANTLHEDALVFDAHVHVVNRQFYHGGDMGQRVDDGQFDLPRAKEGGLDAMFFSLFVTEQYYPARLETKQVLRLIDAAYTQLEKNKDQIELAFTASDVERISRSGKIAAFMDLEGGFDLDGDLAVLRNLYRLGLRSFQLPAHNWTNDFADSCCAPPKWQGLNDRGRAVIREANRLGMVINVSHGSDETIAEAIEVSADPVLATHHGLRSFNNIPRTMPDDLLRKLAAKGGVIGFQIGNEFHNVKVFDWRSKHAGKPFWDTTDIGDNEASMTIEQLDMLVAPQFPMVGIHAPDAIKLTPYEWLGVVERAIELVGEDHVMLGSDFDGGPTLPRGMRDIRDLPMLTEAMLKRGWSEPRIRKFLGGNLLRVVRQVTEASP